MALTRGKVAIVGIFLVALAAAAFAWWFQLGLRRYTQAFYGNTAGMRIARAPRVELLWIAKENLAGDAEPLSIDGEPRYIIAAQDVSKAPGLIHARAALLNDGAYLWQVTATPAAEWKHAIRFGDSSGESVLLFNLDLRQVRRLDSARPAVLGEKLAGGLKTFFEEHRANEEPR